MRRLLVVDDALFMRKLICGVAAEAGWEVVGEAGNGLEALDLYDRLRPDLVTMDLVMPEMGGLEALRRIRAQDPDARVVVVTALDQKQALMDSIREGAIDFIVKPFERQRVLNLLAKLGGGLCKPRRISPPERHGPWAGHDRGVPIGSRGQPDRRGPSCRSTTKSMNRIAARPAAGCAS